MLGMADEFRDDGVAVNALWPQTSISTSAVKNVIGGDEMMRRSRSPQIMADAAMRILTSPAKQVKFRCRVDYVKGIIHVSEMITSLPPSLSGDRKFLRG